MKVAKIILKIILYISILPFVLLAIPFVIIGWLGIDQIARCIAGKAIK